MSSKLMDNLTDFGCNDLDKTLERFVGDEEFYHSILIELLNDSSFRELGDNLKKGDLKGSFESAHMLKGIISNCGITPMTELVVRLVEPLRAGKIDGLIPIYEQLEQKRQELARMLANK